MNLPAHFEQRLDGTAGAIAALRDQLTAIAAAAAAVVDRVTGGGTLYTCGNGGSAPQAMHLAEELIGRYRADRKPWPAVCLAADPGILTCIANDFGYEHVFARQCAALLTERDVLVAFSTSGRSPNIERALQVARATGATTIGLLGGDGGPCPALCDHAIVIAGADSAHIQEAHLVVVHLICEAMEQAR